MGVKLFLVQRAHDGLFALPDGRRVQTFELPVGAMWPCDCHGKQGWQIRIPGESRWAGLGPDDVEHIHVNTWCTLSRNMDQELLWEVNGVPPNITVLPSIHANPGAGPPREWHGHIVNGEIQG